MKKLILVLILVMGTVLIFIQPAQAQIFSDLDNHLIDNGDPISTEGNWKHGIRSTGIKSTINNYNTITTTGNSSSGILSEGKDSIVNNHDTISTEGENSFGIWSQGDGVSVNNVGTINTKGYKAYGIHSTGKDATINNEGLISTKENWSYGIRSTGANATINNIGEISTKGNNSSGIISEGDDATINNSGTIKTNGEKEYGIYSTGNNAKIFNNGKVSTTGDHVILSKGDNAVIYNYGEVSTIWEGSNGLHSNGNNAVIYNYGEIKTTGTGGRGIFAQGNNTTVNNYGSISAKGKNVDGITGVGANTKIYNNGIIQSERAGIQVKGEGTTATNNNIINISGNPDNHDKAGLWGERGTMSLTNSKTGMISVSDARFGDGIINYTDQYLNKERNITNDGTITVEGSKQSRGIYIDSRNEERTVYDKFTITNTGNINVSGGRDLNIGIRAFVSFHDLTIFNSGTINATGKVSVGVGMNGGVLNNSGTINATGNEAYAIYSLRGDEIINLFSGSDITGNISLGGGNDILNLYAGSKVIGNINLGVGDDILNLTLNSIFTGNVYMNDGEDTINVDVTLNSDSPLIARSLIVPDSEIYNVVGELRYGAISNRIITTIDPTEQAVKSSSLASLTEGFHRTLHQKLDTEDNKKVWFQGLYWTREREEEGNHFGYEQKVKGGMGGIEGHIHNLRFGVVGGIASGEVGSNPSFNTESDIYYAGIYSEVKAGFLIFRTTLFGGRESHNSKRYIFNLNRNAIESSTADFKSTFITPGMGVKANILVNNSFTLQPALDMSYAVSWLDDYRYKGAESANISVDDRTLQTFNSTLKLNAIYQKEWFKVGVHVGGTARYTDDGGTLKGDLDGNSYQYQLNNDSSVYGITSGGYVDIAFSDNVHFGFNGEHIERDNGNQTSFNFGLELNF